MTFLVLLPWLIIILADILGLIFASGITYLSLRLYRLGERNFIIPALSWFSYAIALLIEIFYLSMIISSYALEEIIFFEPFAPQYQIFWLTSSLLSLICFFGLLAFYIWREKSACFLIIIPLIKVSIDLAIFLILAVLIGILMKSETRDKTALIGFSMLALSHVTIALEKVFLTGYGLPISSILRFIGLYLLFRIIWKVE